MGGAFEMDRSPARSGGDAAMLGALVVIAGTGLACLYSASYGFAISIGKPPSYFVARQAMWLIPAVAVFSAAALVPLEALAKLMAPIVIGGLALLLLPFVPGIGIVKNGAARWFGFGGQMFQPSELWKPTLVLYLAYILSKKAERLGDVVNGIAPPLVIAAAGAAIIIAQDDFSTAMLVGVVALIMFWISDAPLVFFAAIGSVAAPLASLAVLTSDYRLRRMVGFLAPGYDPADISYQVNGSLRAIAAGGLFGKGLGQGTLKLGSIPLVQSDFIFAAWAEETGFLGVSLFAALWAFFLWRSFGAALRSADAFRGRLAFGLSCYLALQVLINVMVASGIAPATGIPLPFFSQGGSSLLSVSISAGLLYNVSRSASSAALAGDGRAYA